MCRKNPFVYLIVLASFPTISSGQTCIANDTIDYQNRNESLPFVRARWPGLSFTKPRGNPYLGHRNLTYCCIQAVNEYLENGCKNDSRVHVDERLLVEGAQFSCGASWAGDLTGAPEIRVSYAWTRDHCYGWQKSKATNVNQWAQLLVSFILPAVVFSFTLPRPRKMRIWQGFFPTDIGNERLLAGLVGAIGAAVCATIDTIVWLMVVFAFAGPLLLSGLYEAQLDKRVVDFLDDCIKYDRLPLALRARLMFTVLCGNLDMYPAWSDTMDLAKNLDELDKLAPELVESQQRIPRIARRSPSPSDVPDHYTSSQRSQVPLLQQRGDDSIHRPTASEASSTRRSVDTHPDYEKSHSVCEVIEMPSERFKAIRKVTKRLQAMLACQYSFGSTIGGPVVFFLGSFVYAMLEVKQSLGDEDLAEALAFGQWWVIVPHVAIVGGLLLAGNNPNILEGIVSIRDDKYRVGENLIQRTLERRNTVTSIPSISQKSVEDVRRSYSTLMEKVYEADYEPAWMWDRGKVKQDWLLVLFADAWMKYQKDRQLSPEHRRRFAQLLNEAVMLSLADWVFLWLFAFMLVLIPCTFGFLTAYYTPEVGIACRAITFITYMSAQTLLLILWAYHLTWRDRYFVLGWRVNRLLQGRSTTQELDDAILALKEQADKDTNKAELDQYRPKGVLSFLLRHRREDEALTKTYLAREIIFYGLCVFSFGLSLFTSLGGSLLEIIGVYRTALCGVLVKNWRPSRLYQSLLLISTNSREDIEAARRHWIILGAFSSVVLAIVCYIGWWYQKGLRARFRAIANRLDGDPRKKSYEMQVVASR